MFLMRFIIVLFLSILVIVEYFMIPYQKDTLYNFLLFIGDIIIFFMLTVFIIWNIFYKNELLFIIVLLILSFPFWFSFEKYYINHILKKILKILIIY